MTLDASGNLGVGTASIAARIDSTPADGAAAYAVRNWPMIRNEPGASGLDFGGYTASQWDKLRFYTSGTLRLTISSTGTAAFSGKVGVNETSLDDWICVTGTTDNQLKVNTSSSTGLASIHYAYAMTTKATAYYDADKDRLYNKVSAAGVYLANGGTSWTSASDERIKDIIEPISGALSKLQNVRSVIGKFKTDAADKRRAFLMAQDFLTALPEAVDSTDETQLGLNYSDIIPLLVAAIKELSAEVQSLKNA